MEELLYRYNPWWEEKYSLTGVMERPKILEQMKKSLTTPQIIFLTGLRRIGKTTLLKLFIKYLIEAEKINPTAICYISLDDYLLSKKSILELIEDYRKTHKVPFSEKIYLFLDEVVYQKDFEVQLKNIHDNQNIKVYGSSSSASILKTKKPYLTGRHSVIEVLPLDFTEYLTFKNIHIAKRDQHLLEGYFLDFLKTGGLPQYVLQGDIEYIKELVDDIIYKDIVALYKIENPQVLKDFFVLLMERAGKIVSINKLARILGIAPDSAKRYLQMFVDTFLIYLLPRHGKPNAKILAPKKLYVADLGIRNLFAGFRDIGSLFENYVYLKIKHRHPLYIYENGIEIDFLTEDKTLIEVKFGQNMTIDQKELWQGFKADKRVVINDFRDINKVIA